MHTRKRNKGALNDGGQRNAGAGGDILTPNRAGHGPSFAKASEGW